MKKEYYKYNHKNNNIEHFYIPPQVGSTALAQQATTRSLSSSSSKIMTAVKIILFTIAFIIFLAVLINKPY
jgi:hypothetical protein